MQVLASTKAPNEVSARNDECSWMVQVWMKFMRLRGECSLTWVPMSRDEPQQGCYRTRLISRKARPCVLQTTSTSRVQYHQQSGLKSCNVCFVLLHAFLQRKQESPLNSIPLTTLKPPSPASLGLNLCLKGAVGITDSPGPPSPIPPELVRWLRPAETSCLFKHCPIFLATCGSHRHGSYQRDAKYATTQEGSSTGPTRMPRHGEAQQARLHMLGSPCCRAGRCLHRAYMPDAMSSCTSSVPLNTA